MRKWDFVFHKIGGLEHIRVEIPDDVDPYQKAKEIMEQRPGLLSLRTVRDAGDAA